MFCDELFEPFGNDFEEPLVRNNAGTKGFIFLVTSLFNSQANFSILTQKMNKKMHGKSRIHFLFS